MLSRVKDHILFSLILLVGSYIRYIGIQRKEINGDETIYYLISIENTVQQIISISHKFKDHGFLYFLFLKTQHILVQDIPTMRYVNIVFYLISALVFYFLLRRLRLRITALVGVLLLSIHWHFVQISTLLAPYNLVIPLSLVSMYLLTRIVQKGTSSLVEDLAFSFVTALCMYADYSFFYLFYFYLFIFIYSWGIRREILLFRSYVFTLVLTIPGLIQFVRHFQHITILFERVPDVVQLTLDSFIHETARLLVYYPNSWIGIILFISISSITMYFVLYRNRSLSITQYFVTLFSFIFALVTLYIVHQYLFPLYLPRSFWVFHLLLLIISLFGISVVSVKQVVIVMLFGIYFTNIFSYGADSGIQNSTLITEMRKRNPPKRVVLYDPYFSCQAFVSYYFSVKYPTTDKYSSEVKKILSNKPEIIRLRYNKNLEKALDPWKSDKNTTFVMCEEIVYKPLVEGTVYRMHNNIFELM